MPVEIVAVAVECHNFFWANDASQIVRKNLGIVGANNGLQVLIDVKFKHFPFLPLCRFQVFGLIGFSLFWFGLVCFALIGVETRILGV
jgi:hypothetical protein